MRKRQSRLRYYFRELFPKITRHKSCENHEKTVSQRHYDHLRAYNMHILPGYMQGNGTRLIAC